MTKKVVQHIAKNHDNIREGVNSIMGGTVLEYEAKDILRKGISQGQFQLALKMFHNGDITLQKAADLLEISVEEFQERMKNLK